MILTILYIFFLKLCIDLLGLAKNDAYNKANKIYFSIINLIEAMYWIVLYKTILAATNSSWIYVLVFGVAAVVAGLVGTIVKKKIDDRLSGQRKFFVRITVIDPGMVDPIVTELNIHGFELAITENQLYTNGQYHTIIAGSLEDRKKMNEVKNILRNKTGYHVVFIRAEDVFFIR